MAYRVRVGQHVQTFADLKEVMAKATPPRSGDMLPGIAAGSAEESAAARMRLTDLPLTRLLDEPLVPYETDGDTAHPRHS